MLGLARVSQSWTATRPPTDAAPAPQEATFSLVASASAQEMVSISTVDLPSGGLMAVVAGKKAGPFVLEHTEAAVEVAGGFAHVEVSQRYTNPHKQRLEAIYTFPLPENAAVTDMFTQSVANILPGETVFVHIHYSHELKYDEGRYRYDFPMTIGPRFIPATGVVKDEEKITPPMLIPSCARVRSVAFEGAAAVATAEDGTCRFDLAERVVSFSSGPVVFGGCQYSAHEQGVMRRCSRLADEVLPAGSFILSGGRVTALGAPGPADGHVVKIVRGGSSLWVGHFDRGLSRLQDGVWHSWGVGEGLPSVWLDDLAWDGGKLGALALDGSRVAVGETASGLSVWDGTAWSKYRVSDGLPGEDVSAVLFDGGDLWAGTRTGVERVRF